MFLFCLARTCARAPVTQHGERVRVPPPPPSTKAQGRRSESACRLKRQRSAARCPFILHFRRLFYKKKLSKASYKRHRAAFNRTLCLSQTNKANTLLLRCTAEKPKCTLAAESCAQSLHLNATLSPTTPQTVEASRVASLQNPTETEDRGVSFRLSPPRPPPGSGCPRPSSFQHLCARMIKVTLRPQT